MFGVELNIWGPLGTVFSSWMLSYVYVQVYSYNPVAIITVVYLPLLQALFAAGIGAVGSLK